MEKGFPLLLCQKEEGTRQTVSLGAGEDERLQAQGVCQTSAGSQVHSHESTSPSVNMAAGIRHKCLGMEQASKKSSRAEMAPNSSPIPKAEKVHPKLEGQASARALQWSGTRSGRKVPCPQPTCMAGRSEERGKLRTGQFLPSSPRPPSPPLCQVKCLAHLTKTGEGGAEFFG